MRPPFLALVFAACAPGSGQAPSSGSTTPAAHSSNVVCKDRAPTGTSISREVCLSSEERDEDRRGAEAMIRNTTARPEALAPPDADRRGALPEP